MRPVWLNWHASRRDAGSAGRKARRLRTFVQGGLASVLAVAGLVVFATEASAHNNFFQSVSATCNSAPAFGTGATVTWTLYNDWNQSETGTFSTSQGTLSTTALSIPASPTANATPPGCHVPDVYADAERGRPGGPLAQLDHQRELDRDMDRLDPSDRHADHHAGGARAAKRLHHAKDDPDHCDDAWYRPATPCVSESWGDSATVTGSPGGAAPRGLGQLPRVPGVRVSFLVVDVRHRWFPCGHRGQPVLFERERFDLQPRDAIHPTERGHLLLLHGLSPTASESYLTASGTRRVLRREPGLPGIKTTLVTPASPTLGNGWSDTATVSGVYGGGAPLGSVSFYECQASTSPSSTSTCTYTDGTGSLGGHRDQPVVDDRRVWRPTTCRRPRLRRPPPAPTASIRSTHPRRELQPGVGTRRVLRRLAGGHRDDHAHLGCCHRRRWDGL